MISIITPVLNGRKFIQNNIESIKSLTIEYEHIVVDGGSTDGTIEFVQQFEDITLLRQESNTGMYGAIHQGFEVASGNFLTWLNADDILIPEGYEAMLNQGNNENADLIFSNGIYHFVETFRYKKYFAKFFPRYLLKEGIVPFIQPSAIFSQRAYELVGGLNYKNFKLIGDRDLFQRMAYLDELKFLYVPKFSTIFLRHNDSLLYRNLEQREKEYQFCIKTNPTFFNRLIYHFSQYLRYFKWFVISTLKGGNV